VLEFRLSKDCDMKPMHSVILELPVDGNGCDYAEAIALAITDANWYGDLNTAAALVGLLSAIKLTGVHNPEMELGPWLSDAAT
jgi:hypothetical protein